jgi:hypothetical protein
MEGDGLPHTAAADNSLASGRKKENCESPAAGRSWKTEGSFRVAPAQLACPK